jgi:hypothetical protein
MMHYGVVVWVAAENQWRPVLENPNDVGLLRMDFDASERLTLEQAIGRCHRLRDQYPDLKFGVEEYES